MANRKQKLVEIARSFSYKLNCGNYQTADFFCSQKAEVLESEAEKVSEALYEFCKNEVIKSVKKYQKENPKKPKPLNYKEKIKVEDALTNEGKHITHREKVGVK